MTKLAVGPSMRALPTRPLQCSPTLHSLKFLLLANAGAVLTKFSRNLISTWKEVSRNLSGKINLMMVLRGKSSSFLDALASLDFTLVSESVSQ